MLSEQEQNQILLALQGLNIIDEENTKTLLSKLRRIFQNQRVNWIEAVSYTHLDVYKRQGTADLKPPHPVIPILHAQRSLKRFAFSKTRMVRLDDRPALWLQSGIYVKGLQMIQIHVENVRNAIAGACLLYTSRCV